MANARPNSFDFDVTKMFADFRFRPFDVEARMGGAAPQPRGAEPGQPARRRGRPGGRAAADRAGAPDLRGFLGADARPGNAGLDRGARSPRTPNTPSRCSKRASPTAARSPTMATKAGTEAAEVLQKRASERPRRDARRWRASTPPADRHFAAQFRPQAAPAIGSGLFLRLTAAGAPGRASPPCGEVSSRTSPPWLRATSRAIVRPRPTPPVAGLREASSRKNGLKHPLALGGRDARPVIVDQNVDPVVDRHAVSQTWLP